MKRLDKIERLDQVELERPNLRINFQIDKQPGKVLATLKGVTKRFGELTIIENGQAEIERGDKIALIGANGKGKSTLLRIIAGTEKFEGERVWGHNLQESFYAQHQLEALDLNNNILEEMQTCGSGKTDLELRSLLGCFLFGGDEIDKRIKVLSGGEKARVALAKVIVGKANFLMLDEPTNHLDMHSVELLVDALNKYEGSLIFVSHDRFFISKAANKIWEIVDHEIKEFKGTYDEYLAWKERMAKQKAEQEKQQKAELANESKLASMEKKNGKPAYTAPISNSETNQQKKDVQKLQKQFSRVEADISEINKQKTRVEIDMAKPEMYENREKFVQLENEYKLLLQKAAVLNKEYENLFEKIMEAESN